MTDPGDAFLQASKIARKHPKLSAKQIRKMSMDEYARLTGREPFRPSLPVAAPGAAPQVEATRTDEAVPEPEPVSVRDMSPAEYAEYRKTIGMGQSRKEGVGIFDSVSSQSDAYRAAAAQQAGRNAMVQGNVVPSPAIARPNLVNVNQPDLDARPLSERFGTASNAFRYEA